MRSLATLAFSIAIFFASANADAQTAPIGDGHPVPPPLSRSQAKYYKTHPAEWAALLNRLPKVRLSASRKRTTLKPPVAGTWARTIQSPTLGLNNPLLLTDGTVIAHAPCTRGWRKLTPDDQGSYINGTWSPIASLPLGYSPLYFASQILSDGRVIVNGGEYEGCSLVWSNKGAIYDPVTDVWTTLAPPPGWTSIGDAMSLVLGPGGYLLANSLTNQSAIFEPGQGTWSPTIGKFGTNNEENWTLLRFGSVLVTDAYSIAPPGVCGRGSEIYSPSTNRWTSAGNVPVQLGDCNPPDDSSHEIGPLVTRPSGEVVAFSAVTTGPAGTAIYASGAWSVGPDLPIIGIQDYNLADAPALVLPSGNILFAASPGLFKAPSHFWEMTLANGIGSKSDTPNSPSSPSYVLNMLMLPNGQVLEMDGSNDVEIYTPSGTPYPAWKPTITLVPATLTRNTTYVLEGTQLSGVSYGVYGDDAQGATNFPLVRVTNNNGLHRVYYARTSYVTSRGIQHGQAAATEFVLKGMPPGSYSLVAVANGIQSDPIQVTIN